MFTFTLTLITKDAWSQTLMITVDMSCTTQNYFTSLTYYVLIQGSSTCIPCLLSTSFRVHIYEKTQKYPSSMTKVRMIHNTQCTFTCTLVCLIVHSTLCIYYFASFTYCYAYLKFMISITLWDDCLLLFFWLWTI